MNVACSLLLGMHITSIQRIIQCQGGEGVDEGGFELYRFVGCDPLCNAAWGSAFLGSSFDA